MTYQQIKFEEILDDLRGEFRGKLMFNLRDVSSIAGLCTKTIERAIISGELKAIRKSPQSARQIHRKDLARWLSGLNQYNTK